jgi:hypothetical protein
VIDPRQSTSTRTRRHLGLGVVVALVLVMVLGMHDWVFSGDAADPSGNPPSSVAEPPVLSSRRDVGAVPQQLGWDGPACSTAASPFGAATDCSGDRSLARSTGEEPFFLAKPVRREDIERAIGQVEQGSVPALSSYITLRSRCLEQSFDNGGSACPSADELTKMDSRFLLYSEQQATAGNAGAQLALVKWWLLRAHQLLDAQSEDPRIAIDESEQNLVDRMKGHPQFVTAMGKSRERYQQLMANDPAQLEGSRYLSVYTRFGLVETSPTPP